MTAAPTAREEVRSAELTAGSATTGSPQLMASAEPGVVFTSLGQICAGMVCDVCVIDIIESDADGYRISYPDRTARATHPLRATIERTFCGSDERPDFAYRGRATFGWHTREPTHDERSIVDLLLDRAVITVALQQSEQRCGDLTRQVDNLTIALDSSRQIGAALGILMATHKITLEAAFDVLRRTSQRTHRKLREIAADVVDTGWLDPHGRSQP